MPIVKQAAKGREELYARLNQAQQAVQANLERLPRVVQLPLFDDQGPVFEPFARIGLLFTKNLKRVRMAYRKAGVTTGLWEAA